MLNQINDCIADWLKRTGFVSAHLFGSILHRDGVQFDAQSSDVDVVCVFPSECDYFMRWSIARDAGSASRPLNLELLRVLARTDASRPIASLVPVSTLELAAGIHKSGGVDFFEVTPFRCVVSSQTSELGSPYQQGTDAPFHGALDAVRGAQRARNRTLSVSPAGNPGLDSYNGPDALPKDLARAAAQVRFVRDSDATQSQRYDLNEGQVYMLQLLTARRNEHAEVDDLFHRAVVRMNGRGEAGPLSALDQLLLWEILCDDITQGIQATERVAVSVRRRIPRAAARLQTADRAGYCCEFPGCGVPLGADGLGQIAYIRSPYPPGPRHDPGLDREAASTVDNLLFLCPTHHRIIDYQVDEFPAERLREWTRQGPRAPNERFAAEDLSTLTRLIGELDDDRTVCELCDPGEERPPPMVEYRPDDRRPSMEVGTCDWCQGISIRCGFCGVVTPVFEQQYDTDRECDGGCGTRFRIVDDSDPREKTSVQEFVLLSVPEADDD